MIINGTTFSVIVNFFNSENTIVNCINSILSQKFSDFEIICINDGSTDKSLSKIKSINDRNKKIKIINQVNKGLGCSRNVGINNSKGKYICFVDSDDTIESGFLEHAHNKIITLNADLIIYDLMYTYNNPLSLNHNIIKNKSYILEKVSCFYRSQSVCSVIISKSIFTKIIFHFLKIEPLKTFLYYTNCLVSLLTL